MRRRPIPRAPRFSAKLGTLEIQRVLPKSGRGPAKALVRGWPTPIRMNTRTELPPLPRKPVYGPAAREEARRIMREAKRERINFGWTTKTNLCRVATGERPLSYSVWERAQAYVKYVRRERKHEQDVRERPLQVRSDSLPARVSCSSGGEDHRHPEWNPKHRRALKTRAWIRCEGLERKASLTLPSGCPCPHTATRDRRVCFAVEERGDPMVVSMASTRGRQSRQTGSVQSFAAPIRKGRVAGRRARFPERSETRGRRSPLRPGPGCRVA